MKKFFNIFMVLLAFAFATTAFVSCSNDVDDDDDGTPAEPPTLAVYTRNFTAKDGVSGTETIKFYEDKTVNLVNTGRNLNLSGTWGGDITRSGTVMLNGTGFIFRVDTNDNTLLLTHSQENYLFHKVQ